MFTNSLFILLTLLSPWSAAQQETVEEIEAAMLGRPLDIRTDDLDKILEGRIIRVLVTFNRTNFFLRGEKLQGFEYELLKQYEKELNQGRSRREFQTTMVFLPVSRDQLIPYLKQGKGDIAAASLTGTADRQQEAAFSEPYLTKVSEILVTNKSVKGIKGIEDLAGRKVYVMKGSSYEEHLADLNKRFKAEGKTAIEIVGLGHHLETEDILELVNSGAADITVADAYLAELWAAVFPDIVLRKEIAIKTGNDIGWYVRKENPKLLADVSAFLKKNRKGSLLGNILFKRYYQSEEWIKNPLAADATSQMQKFSDLFRKYGEKYNFDWLMLAAVAFQESGLNPNKRSRAGAVGLMQIRPQTAKSVGISDPNNVENNVHAATKYLDQIRTQYFDDPDISPASRVDFALAAYNAGPTRVSRLRRNAASQGYDPNLWFGHVEMLVRKEVGREPIKYVMNVNKYYVTFKLAEEAYLNRTSIKQAAE
jgi:membrane-bound lytic murein transglycosylase MltF